MEKDARTDYAIDPLLAQRWSPRSFLDEPIEPAQVGALLEAARWAPSAFNEQPWRFLVATSTEPERHRKAVACLVPANQAWAGRAPVLILTLAKTTYSHNGAPNRHAWHDLGLAAAQLTVQASALGLHAHQMAGIDADRVRNTYEVPPEFEPVTAIALGRLGPPEALPEDLREREVAERERKSLGEIAFAGRFAAPLEL